MSTTNTPIPAAATVRRHLDAAEPARRRYLRMKNNARSVEWTAEDHRTAEALCIEIADHMRAAALASDDVTEYRRWSWSATKVRETGERHALWADLADFADHLAATEGVAW